MIENYTDLEVFNVLDAEENLEPKRVLVPLGKNKYILKEATAGEVAAYKAAVIKGQVVSEDEEGNVRASATENMAKAEIYLVSLCLYNTDGSLVGENTVQNWRYAIQKKLFEWIRDNSDLRGESTVEELKKERDRINKRIAILERREAGKNSGTLDTTKS